MDKNTGSRGRDVLLVEDEPALLRLAGTLLGQAGYTVRPASTIRDALSILRDEQPLHALVTDLTLSDGSGLTLLGESGRHRPMTRRVLVSGASMPSNLGSAVDAFVRKPYTQSALVTAVGTEYFDRDAVEAAFTQEVAQSFAECAPDLVRSLTSAVQSNAWADARRFAHTLQGSIGMFEPSLAKLAEEVEQRLASGDGGVRAKLDELTKGITRFVNVTHLGRAQ